MLLMRACHQPLAIRQCLEEAKLAIDDVDGIAYTRGPGMPSCLATCALAAKTLAAVHDKPLIGVHHMQAHALTVGLTEEIAPQYPFLCLLVSGGHTLLLSAEGPFSFEIHATTLDDSIGDAFDKVANMLQVPLNGSSSLGHALELLAEEAISDEPDDKLPRAMPGRLAFSFSGLKTAVSKRVALHGQMTQRDKAQLASAFQSAAVGHLEAKIKLVLRDSNLPYSALVASGGVASNACLRGRCVKGIAVSRRANAAYAG